MRVAVLTSPADCAESIFDSLEEALTYLRDPFQTGNVNKKYIALIEFGPFDFAPDTDIYVTWIEEG